MLRSECGVFDRNLVVYAKGLICYAMKYGFKMVDKGEAGVSKDEYDIDLCFRDIILAEYRD